MPDTGKHESGGEEETRLHIIITREQKRQLRIRAAEHGLSMSDYVRKVLFGEAQLAPAA